MSGWWYEASRMSVSDAVRRLGLKGMQTKDGWECMCQSCLSWGGMVVDRRRPTEWSCTKCGASGNSMDYVCLRQWKRPYGPSAHDSFRQWFYVTKYARKRAWEADEEARKARVAAYLKTKADSGGG